MILNFHLNLKINKGLKGINYTKVIFLLLKNHFQ